MSSSVFVFVAPMSLAVLSETVRCNYRRRRGGGGGIAVLPCQIPRKLLIPRKSSSLSPGRRAFPGPLQDDPGIPPHGRGGEEGLGGRGVHGQADGDDVNELLLLTHA